MTTVSHATSSLRASRSDRARTWSAERGIGVGLLLSGPMLLLILALLLLPLVRLISIALGDPGGFGNITEFFAIGANTRVMATTFLDSALVAVLCVLVGAVVAWCLRTTTSRLMSGMLWTAMLLPFLMGTVTKLYAITVLLESHGLVNRIVLATGLREEPFSLLYNQFAVVTGMTYQMLPYAVLPLLAGFYTVDLGLVQAAESLGASRLRALASTVIPLSVPSLLASFTVVYIICVGFFLTPVLLGGATAPFTSSLIAQDIFEFYDINAAAVSALILLIGSLLVIGLTYAVVGRERLARAVTS